MPAVLNFVLLLSASGALAALGPSTNLFIGNKVISPDGFNRSAVLAGGSSSKLQFPGPAITAQKGQPFDIEVVDQLTDTTMLTSTSIHWHGFFQEGSSWADGPVGVTQCPIAPGHSFRYQFSAPDQAGTYWYHSHYAAQYCDGLRGPMVVYDPHDPHRSKYDIDDESTIITLSDWYHTPSPSAGTLPKADAVLVNGLGRFAGGPASPLAVITVIPHKRYRFRLISMSCDPNFTFNIDGHTMTIIEVDGVNVQPLVVDSLQIFAAQRYSFVLNANQPTGSYWVRANPNIGNTGFNGGINSAILRYVGAPAVDPNTTLSVSNPLVESNLHPLSSPRVPGVPKRGAADVNINLNIQFNGTAFNVNNATFQPPSLPVLLQILSKKFTPQELLPAGSVYALPPNKVIEVSLPGGAAGSPHPFHLHGHNFHVIRSAGSTVDNYVNPVIRDVVSIGSAGDNVTIRFATDNSGPWIFHCHIDWHLQLGLAIVFAEDIPSIESSRHPPAFDQLCPTFNALPPQNTVMWKVTSFFALAFATGSLAAIGPSADVYIANKDISPDGHSRSAVLAGTCEEPVHHPGLPGTCKKVSVQFPGPLIQGRKMSGLDSKGDSFNLNVINQLSNTRMLTDTSIHWHGLFQKGSSWADGPVGVTQCPIPSGHSFRYQFKVPDQTGTFWYHSHHSTQYCDGLRGPMVIYDPKDPHKHLYNVDDESTVITLADWYHVFAPDVPKGPSPPPDSTLINGLGRAQNGTASPLAVINVKHGKRYRFRLVSMSCDPFYDFSIDGHDMTIIEADGENVKPLVVKSIRIFAGQRYSFVLCANQPVDNYWVHSIPNVGYRDVGNNANSAILRYLGAEDAIPKANNTVPQHPVLNETDLHPLVDVEVPGVHVPGGADFNRVLSITFINNTFFINNATFQPPPLPILLQILSKNYTPQDLLSPGNYIELPPNKVIELVMPGGSLGSPHPFHLHGHNFHVVRSAGSDTYNFKDPVIRDVVSLGSSVNDRVTIRFVTDNSGPWIMHCHIDWHLEEGLAVVFAEDIKGIKKSQHPPALDELCKISNITGPHHY
ncbi:hypothetical protein CVT25_009561 [Psilocybe cyanescens]|uniref:Laccase n=1 Tax=Psilocybe cyanescens TaxID=93625 RepID=A0A409XVH4_PSICY|nr:hypothetical protein CVT25_009561 [Psilocybe cyanescens]